MFNKTIKIFKMFGFEVKMDWSWLLLGILITWSLAVGLFPSQYPHLDRSDYWMMGLAGAIGLLFSIVVHELTHSIVARRFGLPIRGITLFVFGGVSEMDDEPANPSTEFWMAIMGPVSSAVLALAFWVLAAQGEGLGWSIPVIGVLAYMAYLNVVLAVFNMIPAFPLDGGRVLRAALWQYRKNVTWATRISSASGRFFGIALILLGAFDLLWGNFIGGMWMILIGLFLHGAAKSSYQQVLVRRALQNEPVRRFINDNPIAVEPHRTVSELVENYMYRYHYRMFPIVENSRLLGCVDSARIKQLPREQWAERRVGDLAEQCSADNAVGPETSAAQALSKMSRNGLARLLVVDQERLMGVVTMKDMMEFLAIKLDLDIDLENPPIQSIKT